MMEHIGQHDWFTPLEPHFINEDDLNDSTMERILQNKFYDPMASSESEGEDNGIEIDWDEVFSKNRNEQNLHKVFVPALHPCAPYPQLSALKSQQHYQCLKVLCSQNPLILPECFIPRPTKSDFQVFREVFDIYEKEKKEYITWAKLQWTNGQFARALRPKPVIETVYAAEFNMRAHEMKSFPNVYSMVAQIPLSMRSGFFEMSHPKDLIKVKIKDLPQMDYPVEIKKTFNILRPSLTPEPCVKHLCRFILPGENSMTTLPLTEMHKELAQYAANNESDFVASESALRAIVDTSRTWTLPTSVCETVRPNGDKVNVIVIGSDCPIEKETSQMRTYRAFRHLLEYAVIPPQEKAKILDKNDESRRNSKNDTKESNVLKQEMFDSSDDETNELFIDTGEMDINEQSGITEDITKTGNYEIDEAMEETEQNKCTGNEMTIHLENIGKYSCTCQDTIFERPPPRSFKKWKVINGVDNEKYNIIVHCPLKAKYSNTEVIMEPIIEYQMDLGASEIEETRIDSLSLSLMLHGHASLLKARVEGQTGDVGTFELITPESWRHQHPKSLGRAIERVTAALSHLRTLLPAHYLLHHKPSHGENAMLFAPRAQGMGEKMVISFENALQANIDEAKALSIAPTLSDTLLPYHKYRRILPCAFTPFEHQVAKESKKPVRKQKTPPQAIALGEMETVNGRPKWPKRKRNRRKAKRT